MTRIASLRNSALGLVLLALAATGRPAPLHARQSDTQRFTVDVAEDFTQFVFTPVAAGDPTPRRGSTFVTEGNIFPEGTIQGDGAAFDPNSQGAIGRWLCRGIHLVDAASIPGAAVWVHTAQLFRLPDDRRSLSTEGVEGRSVILRPVTGGTGALRRFVGEQRQQLLGFNATGGVNLRVTFTLRPPTE